jgi:polyisoprenoid-binding protein YceI
VRKFIIYITCFIIFPLTLLGQNSFLKVNKYKVKFAIKNAGIKVDGSFSELDALIIFDEKETNNSFKATVAANTINTGIDARDNHLKKESYFNVEKYPFITIESSKITALGKGKYLANCTVKIKGITKQISLPFTYSFVNNIALIKGNFVLNRLDFKVGESSFLLADDVIIYIEIEANKN